MAEEAAELLPFVSVVIPTCARPGPLTRCLEALAGQTYPRDRYEVVVVDDGGHLAPDIVADFRDRIDLSLLVQPNSGPAGARNTGARQARGELLAFTDDDGTPDAGWLAALAGHFQCEPSAAIGGRVVNALPRNLYSTASQLLVDYLLSYYNGGITREATFATGNNLAFPAVLYWQFGGFDDSFPLAAAEDREICDRWRAQGWHIRFAPNAVVAHAHALDFRSFWRQHRNYGRGAVAFHRARRRRGAGRLRIEPLAFYRRLLLYPFAHEQPRRAAPLAGLLFLSQVAHTLGYLSALRRTGEPQR